MTSFSVRLADLIQRNNVQKRELAARLGINYRNLRYYETGERKPDFDGLVKLAQFFDVSMDYLVGLSDTPESSNEFRWNVDRFEALQKYRGLKRDKISNMIGVSEDILLAYEIGNQKPSLEIALKLADELGVNLGYLTGETNEIPFNLNTELKMGLSRDLMHSELEKMNKASRAVKLQVVFFHKFGAKIAELRKKHNLTQEDLAKHASVPLSAIQDYEHGEKEIVPKRENLEKLAAFFNVTINSLCGEASYPGVWARFLKQHRLNRELTTQQLADLVGIDDDRIIAFEKGGVITDALLIFKLAYVLGLPSSLTFDEADYLLFDYDQYDPQTGEPITELALSEGERIIKELSQNPEAMLMFSDYASASQEDKRMLLEIWRSIKKSRRGEQADGEEIKKDK